MKINKHILKNGLRLLHYYDANTQMVAVNIMYNVGSKDEHPEHTGFAHLFEHLMFAGSANVPDFDEVVQRASGENNAWTNTDVTNYYISLPAHNLETALYLESDRMLALNINQESLDVQKQVVAEEFKQRFLNQPYGDASLLMRPMVYGEHPYAWPTIGKKLEHIEAFCLDDVRAFYEKFYAPNNAVLAICGNVSFENAISLTEKWFGDIPSKSIPERAFSSVERQNSPRRMEVTRSVPMDALYKYWHAPAVSEAGYQACDLLTDILAGGRSARLFQRLVKDRRKFSALDIYVGGEAEKGGGSIQFCGKPLIGVSMEEAEQALLEELQVLASEPVSNEELQKVKNKFESAFLFRNTNCLHIATQLCWYELMGDAEQYLRDFHETLQLQASHLQAMAADIFREDNCSTLYYRAEAAESETSDFIEDFDEDSL